MNKVNSRLESNDKLDSKQLAKASSDQAMLEQVQKLFREKSPMIQSIATSDSYLPPVQIDGKRNEHRPELPAQNANPIAKDRGLDPVLPLLPNDGGAGNAPGTPRAARDAPGSPFGQAPPVIPETESIPGRKDPFKDLPPMDRHRPVNW